MSITYTTEQYNAIFGSSLGDIITSHPGGIVYGAGGCMSKISVSPKPLCLDYFPPVATVDQPYFPPTLPPTGNVPIPDPLLLIMTGVVLMLALMRKRAA